MSKVVLEKKRVKAAAAILLGIQRTRHELSRRLKQLETSLPGLSQDEVFNLAMNKHNPRTWLSQSSVAVERQLCAELGIRRQTAPKRTCPSRFA